MATLLAETTTGSSITVIYPAERRSNQSATVRFRVGKKTLLPAYNDANLPHLVQFQQGQRIIMFMLSDLLQTSYWQKVRNAYTLLGHLDIDEDIKVGAQETERITLWLREQSAARGIAPEVQA
jgi:hypothetical protein